ncbi:DUF4118 domain-containing protein [Streptomyces lydicus]|uniref:DUF4118 domain-containing protein n=1 Tax=Streptomyces lydicus TaxID=47763 RepID=UPI0037A798C3
MTYGVSRTNPAPIFVVAVVAISALGNRFAGAIAALPSACWFDCFLTRPYRRFTHRWRAAAPGILSIAALGAVLLPVCAGRRAGCPPAVRDASTSR